MPTTDTTAPTAVPNALSGDAEDPLDEYFDHAEIAPPGRRRRLGTLTLILLALAVAAAGFVVGVKVQQADEPTATSPFAALGGNLPDLPDGFTFPGGGLPTGAGATTDASTGAAADSSAADTPAPDPTISGSVVLVDGTSLYVEVGEAAPVRVVTDDATVVLSSSGAGTLVDIATDASVIVDGTRTEDGDLQATTVVLLDS